MSLNGLDAPHVHEAYQAAVAEAGGWFLLKYTTRDAVDLLASGKNGVVEARNAIKDYTEASPLYGLIIYRRRKILIKYLPEGTSRLLQARTAVHSQSVLERFQPYETVLDITTADGLNDTSLAASFQLHTASPSPSTSKLDEIREDGEDTGPAAGQSSSAKSPTGGMSAAQKYKAERRMDQLRRRTERSASPLGAGETARQSASDREAPQPPPKNNTAMSQYLVREEQGQTSVTRLESSLSKQSVTEDGTASTRSEDSAMKSTHVSDSASQTTIDASEYANKPAAFDPSDANQERRTRAESSVDREVPDPAQSLRSNSDASTGAMDVQHGKPSLDDDPYDLRKYDEWFKPKVKLGPRPVNPADSKARSSAARVSALPASFKPVAKKQDQARPISYAPKSAAPAPAPVPAPTPATAPLLGSFNYAPPPIPDIPEYDPRPVSRGSIKSTPSHKSTMMTPDKLRLMKAIEHRKKQMRKSREQQSFKPPTPDDVPEVPELPPQVPSKVEKDTALAAEQGTEDGHQNPVNKADSGIELHYDKGAQHEEQSVVQPSEQPREPQEQPGNSVALSQDTTGESASIPEVDDLHQNVERDTRGVDTIAEVDAQPSSHDEAITQNREAVVIEKDEPSAIPTIIMADGSRPLTSEGQKQTMQETTINGASDEEEAGEDQSTSDTLEAPLSPRRQNSDLAKRRRGFVEPLQIEVNSGNPDDFASDDDEFLDELHSATVLQAKPIMVSRSPINSSFPGRRPSADTLASVRSVNITRSAHGERSNSTSDSVSPEPAKSPSSPTTISTPAEKNDALAAMSRNVSSGISKRIQLLTEFNNREVGSSINLQSRPLTPELSPNTFLQQDQRGRKAGVRPKSFRRNSSHRSAQSAATPTPTNENAPTWSVQHDPATNRNSVSVTARIIRPTVIDESNQEDSAAAASAISGDQPSEEDDLPPLNTSISQSNVSSPAMSPATSRFSAEVRTLHSATSRFGRHRQNSSANIDDFPPPPSVQTGSGAPVDEPATSKEGGKTSRFFKRLSNFGGPRRKSNARSGANTASTASIASDVTITAPENDGRVSKASQRTSVAADTPPAVVVGDLNVQFPDSLLWKRRIVTIDESGHLQFAIAHAMEIHKGVAQKRYPLTDFRAPYAPDLDSQELAHSVVLELHDGTALQAACEDAMTQRQVLHLLRTYWKAWTSASSG